MKKLFFLIAFIFSCSFLSAEFNDGKLTKFIQLNIASTTNRGIERYNIPISTEIGLSHTWAEGFAGIQFYSDAFDFTSQATGWLPFASWNFETSRIAIGLGGLYHFQRYKKISKEHDLLANTVFRYKTNSGTTINFNLGYSFKFTSLDALEDYMDEYMFDRHFNIVMQINKVFSNGFEIYIEHGLHDNYRYPLFATPHYLTGAALNFESGLRFAGDISVRIIDGYTTPPYIDSLIIKLSTRFSF
ncbi:MAG: hypothetical protein K5873_10570 [Treponema sp.]|nr:hypothetical protein [Treponema sp.]